MEEIPADELEEIERWIEQTELRNEQADDEIVICDYELLECAVKENRTDVLKYLWLVSDDREQTNYEIIVRAVRAEKITVLNWLIDFDKTALSAWEGMRKSEWRGEWLDASALVAAAEDGRAAALEWLRQQGIATPENLRKLNCYVLLVALGRGHIQVLKWLETLGLTTADDFNSAFTNPWYLISNATLTVFESTVISLAVWGHVETLEWLCQQGQKITKEHYRADQNYILHRAILTNKISALNWLYAQGVATFADFQIKTCGVLLLDKALERQSVANWCAEFLEVLGPKDFQTREQRVIWYNAWRRKVLLLVLAGRRQKRRQPPPELWEYTEQFC
jgi:hypothetical protein